MIRKCLKSNSSKRFVSKNTSDGMRINYLSKVFPDSLFIHVLRDGRANVNSYLNVSFFKDIGFWWNDNKTLDDWLNEGNNQLELAARHWRNNVEEILKQKSSLPKNRYFEIKYEEFTSNPIYSFKKVIDFCELNWDDHFKSIIKNSNFENRDYKWRERFSTDEIDRINSIVIPTMEKIGYDSN